MLVLARKVNEAIQVGTVEVRILEIEGRIVKIGITAPLNVKIMRSELLTAVCEELLEA